MMVANFGESGTYRYLPADQVGRFLNDLGFVLPDELATKPLIDASHGSISTEQIDLFDTDVLVWWFVTDESGRDAIRANPLYARLDVATQRRDVFLYSGGALNEAISYTTVLSMPFLLEEFVPVLAAAVDGDQATTAPGAG